MKNSMLHNDSSAQSKRSFDRLMFYHKHIHCSISILLSWLNLVTNHYLTIYSNHVILSLIILVDNKISTSKRSIVKHLNVR